MKRCFACLLALALALCGSAAIAEESRVTMLAVGDNLIHQEILDAAKTETGYDFSMLYRNLRADISGADIAVINQETMLVASDELVSGWPSFGSPYALGDAIRDAGFDVVLCANNHSFDKEEQGVLDTLAYWRQYPEMTVAGIHDDKADAFTFPVVTVNGMSIAIVNLSYYLNCGYIKSPSRSFYVDTMYVRDKGMAELKAAREAADIVVAFFHVGREYNFQPNSKAVLWAQRAADAGADIAVLSHPHVLGQVQELKGKNGHVMPVLYSLGNYVSAQKKAICMVGGMAQMTFVKDENGARLESYSLTPLITHYEADLKDFTVYKLSDYTQALAERHYLAKDGDRKFTYQGIWKNALDKIKYFQSKD